MNKIKYALVDTRRNFQIAYIGETNNFEKRVIQHKCEYNKQETKTPIPSAFYEFGKKLEWFNEMKAHNTCFEAFIIDEKGEFTESAWARAFDKFFNLKNHISSVSRARNKKEFKDYSITVFKEVPDKRVIEEILKIQKAGYALDLKYKVSISTHNMLDRNGDKSYEYTYKTYLPFHLNSAEEYIFIKEYQELKNGFEQNGFSSLCIDDLIPFILNTQLYKLDTPAKIAFVRDYFNNDFYNIFLRQDIFDELDEQYFFENLEILYKNQIFPKNIHFKEIKKIYEKIKTPHLKEINEFILKTEILN